MDADEQRRELDVLIAGNGASLAALSRMLGRNAAWLQQYLRRGTPRWLPEAERGRLARYFGVDEARLGGAATTAVAVPRLDVAASAGPGRIVDPAARREPVAYARAELAGLGVGADDASEIRVEGDSMAPTLRDGDRILVDRARRAPTGPGAIWVLRVDDALWVKRLVRDGPRWRIVSDAADWPDVWRGLGEVEIVGRVVQLVRRL